MRTHQLDISDLATQRLKDIRRLLGLRNNTELFQNALVILSWIASEKQERRAIVSVDKKTGAQKELCLPSLKRAVRNPVYDLHVERSFTELKDEFAAALK
jgi:hypothetical protein